MENTFFNKFQFSQQDVGLTGEAKACFFENDNN